MLDANTIINQVQSGTAPASWQALRGRRSFFVQGAIWGVVGAVLAVAAAAYLLTSGTVVGYGINDQTPDNVLGFWFIADMIVLALCVIGGIIFSIMRLVALGSVENQLLVLMPEGFLMRTGTSEKATRLILYQNIAKIVPRVRNGAVSLMLQTRSGGTAQVPLDSRFSKPKPLAQQIQGMHAAYVRAAINPRQGS
jgi:hypothetical protein